MDKQRDLRAKLNIVISLISQIVVLLCGLVVPKMMIGTFGSEAYGATASITQFLAFITLLEGGIGGVARAALYKPLADHDHYKISAVMSEIRHFFRLIGYVFIIYVLVLALTFKYISNVECFDTITTFLLVIVISISTFAQYFIGISYSVLIQADQRTYITQIVSIVTNILNTIMIVILINLGSNLIIVKLVSSCIFVLRPVMMRQYVKKNYMIVNVHERNEELLNQKWTGLGQHIAFFLHSNTDIAVLTIFSKLSTVAIYSVYNMISSNLQNLTVSFVAGMEALFGNMLAKKEYSQLQKTFGYYETLISFVTIVLYSVAIVLIVPFVSVYTLGINDANYSQPVFSFLLLFSSVIYCLRMPYHSMTIAAGHFKQTRMAAYGEAVINISLSIILVIKFDLVGVAIGTVIAILFRFVFYAVYLSKNIFYRDIKLFVKRMIVNMLNMSIILLIGKYLVLQFRIDSYFHWAMVGCIIFPLAILITVIFNALFYREDLCLILRRFIRKK